MSQQSEAGFHHSLRTAGYSEVMVQMARAGGVLGRTASRIFVSTVEDFASLVHAGSDLRQFVLVSTHTHVGHHRFLLANVDAVDRSTDFRPRWYWRVMEHAFGLYCLVRRRAVPRQPQPVQRMGITGHVPRALHRRLQVRGVHSGAVHSAVELHNRATNRLRLRWDALRDRQLVLWMDNFVRPRYSHNPAMAGRLTLNASALAVMYVGVRLRPSPGLVPVVQLVSYQRSAAREAVAYQRVFADIWGRVLETDLSVDDFRVPLDVVRPPQSRVCWLPFGVSACNVQSNSNLVDLLELAQTLQRHSGGPMPILLDLDIWYRLVKLAYASNAVQWKVSAVLREMPLLYGVWHPYKYVLTMVYRRFHSHLVFLREGTVADGFACGSKVDVRAAELFMAAILVVPRRDRVALRNSIRVVGGLVQRLGERVVRLEALIARESSALRLGEEQYRAASRRTARSLGNLRDLQRARDARLQTFKDDLERVVVELQARKDEKNRMVALSLLLEQYAPACLAIGMLVRDCSWRHRTVETGDSAKKVLMAALSVLLKLVPRPHTLEYVRTLCVALTCWRGWNDHCPGVCYSEERCEALLSKLGRRCNQYPGHVSATEVEDLFLALVSAPQAGRIVLKSHKPTPALVAAVSANLARVVAGGGSVIRYVPWTSDRILHVESTWPEDFVFPGDLNEPLGMDTMADIFCYEMNVLLRADLRIGDAFKAKLDAKVARRSRRDEEARRRQLEDAVASMPVPRQFTRRIGAEM